MRNPSPNPSDVDSNTIMRYHFYVSNNKTNDSAFVQHCLLLHWQDMLKDGWRPKQHSIWSSGYSSQFKSKVPLFFVSRYPQLTNGCVCLWSFFGSSHGKNPHDEASVDVNRFIRQAQLDVQDPQL
jgi:hypothetical protein